MVSEQNLPEPENHEVRESLDYLIPKIKIGELLVCSQCNYWMQRPYPANCPKCNWQLNRLIEAKIQQDELIQQRYFIRCDLCGYLFPERNKTKCLVCGKVLCSSCQHHKFCGNHWDALPPTIKHDFMVHRHCSGVDLRITFNSRYHCFYTLWISLYLLFSAIL